jgi:hypothetical protein
MAGDKDLQFGLVADRVIALIHTAQPPSDTAWEAHHALIYQAMGERYVDIGYFVITAGGAPTPKQRRIGNQHVKGRKMVRAIVTDSFVVRQLIKSWAWFAPGLASFAPAELRAGLAYVGVGPEQLAAVWPKIVALNAALEPPVSWLPATL